MFCAMKPLHDFHILNPTGLTVQRLLPTRVDFYKEESGGEYTTAVSFL
jgi:hypothetical protein